MRANHVKMKKLRIVELSKSKLRIIISSLIEDRRTPPYVILGDEEGNIRELICIDSIKKGIEVLKKGYIWLLSIVPRFHEEIGLWGMERKFYGYWLTSASGLDFLIKVKKPFDWVPNIPKVVMDALKKGEFSVYKLKK